MNSALLRSITHVGLAAVCCAACGSAPDAGPAPPIAVEKSPLLGSWRWAGNSPGPTALLLTFNADDTLAFMEQVQPASLPAGASPLPPPGFDPDTCVPVLFCNGTYEDTVEQGIHTLSWTFTDGTKDAISGCSDAARDSLGVPLSEGEVADFIEQGHLPPATLSVEVSASELRVTSALTSSAGVGRGDGTTFTKAP